jgi:LysM repeat protein
MMLRRVLVVLGCLMLAAFGCNLSGEVSAPDTPIPAPVVTATHVVTPTAVVVAGAVVPVITPTALVRVPTRTPTPVCLPRADWGPYSAAPGDSLSALAAAAGIPVSELAAANCLSEFDALAVGQIVRLPGMPTRPGPTATPTVICPEIYFFAPEEGGCPAGPARQVEAAYQPFEHGHMLWRADRDEIIVLFGDGDVMFYPAREVQILPDNPVDRPPPEARVKPASGFGRVWGAYEGVQQMLGWALADERGYTMTVQPASAEIPPESIQSYLTSRVDLPLYYLTLPDGRVVRLGLHRWWFVSG